MVDNRDGNDSNPGGTPPESEYESANDATTTLDDIYASIDTDLLVSS